MYKTIDILFSQASDNWYEKLKDIRKAFDELSSLVNANNGRELSWSIQQIATYSYVIIATFWVDKETTSSTDSINAE